MIALGLGSSDLDALNWLRRAVAALHADLSIQSISPLYESDALMPAGAPPEWNVPYYNLVVTAQDPGCKPEILLERIKRIESRLGRRERERWAPREIDIDILAWQGVKQTSERLTIPHAGLLERPFALLPLADIAAAWAPADPRLAEWRKPGATVPFRTRRATARLTELVAIFNVTPDSFSDGGTLPHESAVRSRALEAISHGATILDVGAESTRPGAQTVTPEQELERLIPAWRVLTELRRATPGLRLSLDSRNPATVERMLELGAPDWINDVEGFQNPRMRELARAAGPAVECVAMHSLGVPPSRDRVLPPGCDAIETLVQWGRTRLEDLERAGIDPARVILDPGVGFGKTPEQNLELIRHAGRLRAWGARTLIGHSRKSFLAPLFGPGLKAPAAPATPPAHERDLETAILSVALADQSVEYLRVHDIASQARALRLSALLC